MHDHIIVRDLHHPVEAVRKALEPKQLREWAPVGAGERMRWELKRLDNGGTQLTLIATGAGRWNISVDALAAYLDGKPYPRQDVLRISTK